MSDANNNGLIDINERVIAGVLVKLTGTTTGGQSVSQSATDRHRRHLPVRQLAGGNVHDHRDAVRPATPTASTRSARWAAPRRTTSSPASSWPPAPWASNYNFGEQQVVGAAYAANQTATIAYWSGSQGQNLIKALNGWSSATALSELAGHELQQHVRRQRRHQQSDRQDERPGRVVTTRACSRRPRRSWKPKRWPWPWPST